MLSNPKTGLLIDLDGIYDIANITEVWEDIAKSHGVNLSEPIEIDRNMKPVSRTGVIKGRSLPRRFDKRRISNETKQRICEHVLLDFCCLNKPLPPPCDHLYCKLNHGEGEDGKMNRLQIQPWTFPA